MMIKQFLTPALFGVLFGLGFVIGRLTAPPVILEPHTSLKDQARLFKETQKELELSYYSELLKDPKRTVEEQELELSEALEQQAAKPKDRQNTSVNIEQGLKASPDRIAKALAGVLGQETPASIQDVIEHSLPTSTGSAYAVQIASFPKEKQAKDLAKHWKLEGHNTKVVQAELSGIGKVYRVRIHGFNTREEAEAYRIKKQIEGISVAQ